MPHLLEEFRRRYQPLFSMDPMQAQPRLAGFLEWLESKPETRRILAQIRNQVDMEALLRNRRGEEPVKAGTTEEIAAVGLFLMEECRKGAELWGLAMDVGVASVDTSTRIDDYARDALKTYIAPTLQFIENQLADAEMISSAHALIDGQMGNVLSSIVEPLYPGTAQKLNRISQEFLKSEEDGSWLNIGNSCRDALISFATEYRERHEDALPSDIKVADVKSTLKYFIEASLSESRFRQTLIALTVAVWDHSQTITHRETTTKDEARRLFVWTCLAIGEVASAPQESDPTRPAP